MEGIHGSVRTRERTSKYGNEKARSTDGKYAFPSRHERNRYDELAIEQAAGLIRDLELQVRYRIEVAGVHICDYIADFRYFDASASVVVEDAKGAKTAVYRLKKKLMRAVHGIEIQEV